MSKYRLKYDWDCEPGSFCKEDVKKNTEGLCDAMLVVSIIKPEDGGYSQLLMSMDGATKKELTQADIFKVWLMMGLGLAQKKGLSPNKQELVDAFAECIRTTFAVNKE